MWAKVKSIVTLKLHPNRGGFVKDRDSRWEVCLTRLDNQLHWKCSPAWPYDKDEVPVVYPAFMKELLANKSDGDILEHIEAVFKNLHVTYIKNDQSNLESDTEGEDDAEVCKQKNWCLQQKSRVSISPVPASILTPSSESRGENESCHRLQHGYWRPRMGFQTCVSSLMQHWCWIQTLILMTLMRSWHHQHWNHGSLIHCYIRPNSSKYGCNN